MRSKSTVLSCVGGLFRPFSGDNDATNADDGLVHCQKIVRGIIRDGDGCRKGQVAGGSRAVVDGARG